jgi:glycosyltransferase involved in cell wall biosynthesis
MKNLPGTARVIVLLAHYNDADRLIKAIQSIQEPFPVDVLIVDDGSTKKPDAKALQEIYTNGTLQVHYLPQNMGSEKARNAGMKMLFEWNYEFVAGMDSDDLNKPERFAKQLSFLDAHPDVMLMGSWCDCIDGDGNYLFTQKYPTEDRDIKKMMYINSMFAHASLVFRKAMLPSTGFYPEDNKWAEDYALAFNATRLFKVANYPEALIYYTIHGAGISSMHRRGQVVSRLKIILKHFYWGFYPIYGILRNLPLLLVSRELLTPLKKLIKRG